MEILKNYTTGIVLLIVIAILWAGILLYSTRSYSEVNPNAQTYAKPLNKEFDLETLEKVQERTRRSFPVLPAEFFNLKSD
jgi:hypothetical protein